MLLSDATVSPVKLSLDEGNILQFKVKLALGIAKLRISQKIEEMKCHFANKLAM